VSKKCQILLKVYSKESDNLLRDSRTGAYFFCNENYCLLFAKIYQYLIQSRNRCLR